MDFNAASLPVLDEDQICSLVARNEEHQLFDYKGPMTWDESTHVAIELVKDVLALANSGGGHLVIGVAEKVGGGFDPVGLSDEEVGSWETTRLGNKVRAYADPPVSLHVRAATCSGRKFVVVTVDGFQRLPHICKKSFQSNGGKRVLAASTLYIRTVTCESRPVQTSDELNDIIDRAVRTRQDQMLTAMRSVMIGASTPTNADARAAFEQQIAESLQEASVSDPEPPYDGLYTDVMFPSRFEEDRFTRSQLNEALSAASTVYYGWWPFLYYRGADKYITTLPDGFRLEYAASTSEVSGSPIDRYWYWRLRRSGLLVAESLVWEDAHFAPKGDRRVNKNSIVVHVAQSIDALVGMYTQLGIDDEDVTWSFTFSGTRDRRLADPPSILPYPGQDEPVKEASVSYRRTRSIEEWRAGLLDHVVETTRDIFEQFNARFINDGDIREQAGKHLGLRT